MSEERTSDSELIYSDSDNDSSPNTSSKENSKMDLYLGDVIEIVAPSNSEIHEGSFYIYYIDEQKVRTINVANLEHLDLTLKEDSTNDNMGFTDESIIGVILQSRSEVEGYARQNNLFPDTWVDIHFSGDIPMIITGQITSLEEDKIGITTIPELRIIYIDFGYSGLPENSFIDRIVIREKPASLANVESLSNVGSIDDAEQESLESDASMEWLDSGELVIDIPEDIPADENRMEELRDVYRKTTGIVFGKSLGSIAQAIEIPENQKRYGIDVQLVSLMDELLSIIPNSKRSKSVMEKVQTMVERFKELRQMFSTFDSNDNIRYMKTNDPNTHKPLVQLLKTLEKKVQWVMPIVSLKKKVYLEEDEQQDLDEDTDITVRNLSADLIQEEAIKTNTYYKNRTQGGQVNYENMHRQMDSYMTPFDPAYRDKRDEALITSPVATSMEAVVDTLDNFYSNVLKAGQKRVDILKQRYVIQTYNTGMERLTKTYEGAVEVTKKNRMTQPNKMTIKSIVLLPASVMQHSRIGLGNTNIMDRANLHHHLFMPFRLLRNNTDIVPYVLEDLKKEIDYENEDEDKDGKQDFLNVMTEYIYTDPASTDGDIEEQREKFEKYLSAIIPKTRTLIRLIRKYIVDKVSFLQVVQALEPFAIYSQDISYKQYMEIRYFIKTKIEDIKKSVVQKKNSFDRYKTHRYQVRTMPISILSYLEKNKEIMNLFLQGYKLPEQEVLNKTMTSHEVLIHILKIDNGVLFSRLLSALLSSLITPDKLMDTFGDPSDMYDDMDKQSLKKAEDCLRRVITKKYTKVSDLQDDNRKAEVYYDKEFDTTPYHILMKYKDEQKKRLPEEFPEFLAENLIQKHDCPKEKAIDLAKNLIAGKKEIKEGEYAMLEIRPQLPAGVKESDLSEKEREQIEVEGKAYSKIQYYLRRHGNWVLDKDIDYESFVDNNTLFCNMKDSCSKTKMDSNGINDDCESNELVAIRLREAEKKKVMKEFDRRYDMTVEEIQQNLEKNIVKQMKHIIRWNNLRQMDERKYDRKARIMGNTLTNTDEELDLLIYSPHTKLLEMILGEEDFIEKQLNIVKFFNKFCREPIFSEGESADSEDPYWYYCRETNTKLLPSFLYELADCFVMGGDYNLKLKQVCADQGELSEDGDAIVDKFGSGRVITKIDFSDEEGFNESGFRISTHSIMEMGLGQQVLEGLNNSKKEREFENDEVKEIFNVAYSISQNMGVTFELVEEIVLREAYSIFKKTMPSEAKYKTMARDVEQKTGKKVVSFKMKRNKTMVTTTAAVLFVAIQTLIPSLVTKKVYPGCVKSFDGYPMTGIEDDTGLKYMSCVLFSMKTSVEPWNGIEKSAAPAILIDLKAILEKDIIGNPSIDALYENKRLYLEVNPDTSIVPKDLSIEKWLHFMPPLVDTNVIKGLETVGSSFLSDFENLMKRGHKDQLKSRNVLKTKMARFSTAIVEAIQEIVEKKDTLLKTSSNQPFLQNACCSEPDKSSIPMEYFKSEDESIERYIKTAAILSAFSQKVERYARAGAIFDERNTRIKQVNETASQSVSKRSMYEAIIHYCKLDRGTNIPQEFHQFFTEIPVGYNSSWSIEEKVALLEREKQFTPEDIFQLMLIVNSKNILPIRELTQKTNAFENPLEMVRDILDVFENTNSQIVEGPLIDRMRDVLDKYDAKKMISPLNNEAEEDEDLPEQVKVLNKLKNYLNSANTRMFADIMTFMEDNHEMSNAVNRKVREFLIDITKWEIEEDQPTYYDNSLYTVFQFFKNSVYEFTHVFPNILLNNVENNRIHKYWGLMELDQMDLYNTVKKYYADMEKFKGDAVLSRLLLDIELKLTDLNTFLKVLPVFTPIRHGNKTFFSLFDKECAYLLFQYTYYSVLYEYITAADDHNLLREDRNEKKRENRKKIVERADISTQISMESVELDEDLEEEFEGLIDVEITIGNQGELKKRVASLLFAFIQISITNKGYADFSYKSIEKRIRGYKQKEKKRIVDRLEAMSIEERRIENLKKNYKLENWNVGMQKGLVSYDAETQMRERNENRLQGYIDIDEELEAENGSNLLEAHDVEDLEAQEVADEELEMENELEVNLEGLGSGWHDGGYYTEDDEDDFRDD